MTNLPPARHTAGNTVIAVDEIQKAPAAGLPVAQSFKMATMLLFGFQILMILLLGTCGRDSYHKNGADFTNYYNAFSGVEIMMFIGFGYLMTFLKRYGMGAVGLTMLITVVALQWGVWIDVSFRNLHTNFFLKPCFLKMPFDPFKNAVVLFYVVRDRLELHSYEYQDLGHRPNPRCFDSHLVRCDHRQGESSPARHHGAHGGVVLRVQQVHLP